MELNSSTDLFLSRNSINRLSSFINTKAEKVLCLSLTVSLLIGLSLMIALIVASKRGPVSERSDMCESEVCVNISREIHSFIDSSVDPCTDFYEYSCGKWIKDYQLPDTSLEGGPIVSSQQRINRQIRVFLEGKVNPDNSTAVSKAISYFTACSSPRERGKSASLLKQMLLLKGLSFPLIDGSRVFDLLKLIATMNRFDFPGRIFAFKTRAEDGSRQRSLIQISPSVTNEINSIPETSEVYVKLMRTAFDSLNLQYTQETIDQIIGLQKDLFTIASTSASALNRFSFHDLQQEMGHIPWRVLLHDFNTIPLLVDPIEKRYLLSKEYVERAHELMMRDPHVSANYLGWKIIQYLMPYTTNDLRKESFQLENVTYQVPAQKDLMEECTSETIGFFRFAVGKLFYDIIADKEERAEVQQIMSYVRKAYNKRMKESQWLDQQTRPHVMRKLKGLLVDYFLPAELSFRVTFDRKPPYADIDEFYSAIQVPKTSTESLLLVEWVLAMRKFAWDMILKEMLTNADEQVYYSWDRIPTEFSAAYVTTWNLVIVPVAVLSDPWYQGNRPKAMNFGALGFVLAHEVAHAFDPTSYQYDYKGEKRPDDWSPECQAKHSERSKCFVDQYRGFKFMGHDVDPERTMVENIADGEGLRLAFEAFKIYKENHPEIRNLRLPLDMKDYDDEQLFFLSFANSMCWKFRNPEYVHAMSQTDPHAPRKIRVLGSLMNSDFGRVFSCGQSSKLNPGKKCSFW